MFFAVFFRSRLGRSNNLTANGRHPITLNSSNNVTNEGTIQVQDKSNQVGILAIGGNTGTVTNTGSINFNSSSTLTATDSNGIVTGPFANLTNLIGIHVVGPGTLTGDIDNSGTINIQGDNSQAILLESAMSFFGFGVQPPTPTWGNLLNEATQYLDTAPWLAVPPGLLIFAAVLAVNAMGDGLRDAIDARN